MAEERQTAVERDRKRQTGQKDTLLERVQDILNNIQLQKMQNEPDSLPPTFGSKTSPLSSIRPTAAVSHCVGLCLSPAQNQTLSPSSSLKKETLRLLNQRMVRVKNISEHLHRSSDESSDSIDSVLGGLSFSLTGSYAQLPSPQPSRSPLAHCARRPRPQTAAHILISCPVSESELSLNESESEAQQHSTFNESCLPPSGAEWNCSCSKLSDRQLSITTSTPNSASSRKETTSITRSPQDVTCEKGKPAHRSPPAPLNQSYDVESPSPSLIRPQVVSTPSSGSVRMVRHRLQLEGDSHEQEVSVKTMKAFCRLSAVARGFLTRRLLQTCKITHLRKTIQDSREFIRSFQTESQLKRVSVSHQDLTLQHRLTAQLRAALHDVHKIFFVWPLKNRLQLLQQDREIRKERRLREMEKPKSPANTQILSSATLKTLHRKTHRQVKKMKVLPKSPATRILQTSLCQNGVCSSQQFKLQSALKKRDECSGVRQHLVKRKHLSLG
ncbi:centriolar coiled-coil protein of 110 kDa [Myxocyprinus asiaticus]|uniref:centriolar coiled-coil protein of 110 kDa n=1 Tax=Myxocyprinus asiaticus TaxID=70543 RepID=UPI0022231D5B|nr:centriolar coiled-coil protein of 110 kDa [Myxocyprinus asiaticus]